MKHIFILLAVTLVFGACKKKNVVKEEPVKTEDCIDGYTFVHVRGEVNPRLVSSAYQMFDLRIFSLVDREKNTAIYSFNKEKIRPDSLFRLLNESQFATKARCLYTSESKLLTRP